MNTEFWLFGQFNSAVLTFAQVEKLTGLAPKSIRNMMSAGKFPKALPGGGYALQDIATWIDSHRDAKAA